MHEIFKDILALQGVGGVMLISLSGEILYQKFRPAVSNPVQSRDWGLFFKTLENIAETDLVFSDGRLYVRRTGRGYIVVVSSQFAQSAMIRLHCDILLPELAKTKSKKKKRFFKR